jgi:IclR family KDG regulon transcriptional repressor
MKSDKSKGTQAVHRAISVLRAFSTEDMEMGVAEVSRKMGLHVSTTHRLLQSLVAEGLITQDPDTARYRLGVGLIPLADLARQSNILPRIAEPHARHLAQQWGEAVNLDVFNHELHVMSVVQIPSSYLLQVTADYITPMPPHCTSTGKVLLAYSPAPLVQSVLAKGLVAKTRTTITDGAMLLKELEETRQHGYATNLGELEDGLHAVGAPVRDRTGQVIAALSMGGPAARISPEKLPAIAQAVIEAADLISHDLGWKTGSIAANALAIRP